jgi:nucleoside-diphosphate-sugar epimerase
MGVTSPVTPYAAAKLAAETALLGLRDASFGVAILRGATAFGPSPVPRTDLLLNELCAEAACGRPLELQSDGQSWRPFMPVGDFARALCTAALQTPQDGADLPVWNIAPPQMQMTVRTATERAAAVAQTLPPRLGPQSAPDRRSYRVSGARFVQAYPDFTYSDDFDGMIASTIREFKAIPTLAQDLRADRFVRLAQLKRAQLAKSA